MLRSNFMAMAALVVAGSASAARAQAVWQPLPTSPSKSPSARQTVWEPITGQRDAGSSPQVVWERLPAATVDAVGASPGEPGGAAASGSKAAKPAFQPPTSQQEAEALLKALWPTPADYVPLLRLGPAVTTANQVPDQEAQFSFFQLAPLAGGGVPGGTGNQNYVGRLDLGFTETLQISAFYSEADDPLFAQINGKSPNPANFWQSYGGAVQVQILNRNAWKLGFAGSLEAWNVGSGGCDTFSCKDNISASPNIFNNSGQRVFTKNLVGSLALPLSWQASRALQLTFTPGVSFLPATQGSGQGGAGSFYGTNITVAGGGAWRLAPQLTLFGSGLIPLGPGTNSFNANLQFQRVPILSGGVNWAMNPRIGLEAALTNGFGGTPATAVLALPSDNQLGYTLRFSYNPTARDTPQPALSPRQRSIALGGLTVNTALVPPDGRTQLWANADSGGNVFGYVGYSISNIFQVDLFKSGWFNNVPQTSPLADTYANNGAPQWRIGGKAVALSPLRGFPLWAAGRISFGRENPPGSGEGYVFAETINTWEASRSLALHLNPKLAWSGVATAIGIGLGANLQLGPSFQLIPEANVVASDIQQSNATLALRWLASTSLNLELYVSNAAGLFDIGQLLGAQQARLGGRLLFSF